MEGKRKPRSAELLTGMVKLVAELEGKRVELINEEFGEAIRCGSARFERYRSGSVFLRDPAEVRYLAKAGVERGLLGAKWLREFLQATAYPHPEALVAELVGEVLVAPRPPVVQAPWYDNLDAAPFAGSFVARRELLSALLAALTETPVVVLLGMGGMGKTSLAYHLATLCRERRPSVDGLRAPRQPGAIPAVQAVVWVSDAARPGATTREQLLDAIARTLDHPGLSAYPLDEKAEQVLRLLASIPTLIMLDNAETIGDPTLLPWLLQLPRGTLVLITSRQMVEHYSDERVKVLPLAGLSDPEARRLIKEQAKHLGLEHLDPVAQQALIQRSGSCPQALKQLLGYAKRARQPLSTVVERFDALAGDLLADLFARFWDEVLGEEARRLLVALTCFHYPVARAALGRVTAFAPSVLDAAIVQLGDASLIEEVVSPFDAGEPRFGLHPLTRAFAEARLASYAAFVAGAEARLVAWAADYADSFGYKVSDLGLLARLEADEATLMQALRVAAGRAQHAALIRLAKGLEFFYYIKCRWDDKLTLHEHYIAAATALADVGEQINALTMHSQLLCRLGRPEAAQIFLARLEPLEAAAAGEEQFHIRHARALYHYTRGEHALAQTHWTTIAQQAGAWGLPEHMSIGALHWLGLSQKQMGDPTLARKLFERSLELAQQTPQPIARWVARNQLQLALLDIATNKLTQAQRRLEASHALLAETDREQRAHLRRGEAWLSDAQGKPFEACEAFYEARDLFARMGLLHELADDEQHFRRRGCV